MAEVTNALVRTGFDQARVERSPTRTDGAAGRAPDPRAGRGRPDAVGREAPPTAPPPSTNAGRAPVADASASIAAQEENTRVGPETSNPRAFRLGLAAYRAVQGAGGGRRDEDAVEAPRQAYDLRA